MKLTKFELQKLIEPFLIVCIGILIVLSVITIYGTYNSGIILGFYNGDSHHYKGMEYIDNNKKYAYQYSDRIVDDEFFLEFSMQSIDSSLLDINGNNDPDEYPIIISSLYQYYLKFSWTGDKLMYGEISTDVQSVFKGELPVFKYTDNWKTIQGILPNIQLFLTIFAVILSSLMFSKEYTSGMTPIILTAKHGRKHFAITKIKTFYMFVSTVYLIFSAVVIIAGGFLWGFENPFADIRVITNGAYVSMENPISCVTLILFQLLTGFLSIMIISSVGILISSLIKSPYISMVITASVFFFPLLIKVEDLKSEFVKQAVMLMPYNIPAILSSFWSIFEYSSIVILIVLALTAVIAILSSVLSVRIYSSHKIS